METLRVMWRNMDQVNSAKLNKLDLSEHRLGELERNVGIVNTELKDMKAKVNGFEESMIFINNSLEKSLNTIKALSKPQ